MENSKTNLSIRGIINEFLTATPSVNLYHLYIEKTENLSEEFKKTILKELQRPFRELYLDNLKFLFPDELKLLPSAKYNLKIIDPLEGSITEKDATFLYHNDSSTNWDKNKQKQINEILSLHSLKPVTTNSTFPAFHKKTTIGVKQIELLFDKLNKLDLIRETDTEKFTNCFTKSLLKKQPHIKFYEKPQILYHLFKLMIDYGLILDIDKNDIFVKNQLFVDKIGNPFKTSLTNGLDALKEYPKNKTKKDLIQTLEKIFIEIFKK